MIQLRAARPADASIIAGIHADSSKLAYASLLPPEVMAEKGYDKRLQFWKKTLVQAPQGVFLAEDDALGPMGFVSCGAAREPLRIDMGNFRGEIYALYVRPVCQGMGLGLQLLESAIANLSRAGYSAVMLWVLAENPATGFYQRAGGQQIGERTEIMGGKEIRETAYGWGGRLPTPKPPDRGTRVK